MRLLGRARPVSYVDRDSGAKPLTFPVGTQREVGVALRVSRSCLRGGQPLLVACNVVSTGGIVLLESEPVETKALALS